MQEISHFFGIIISIQAEAGAKHGLPRFHAISGVMEAVYEITETDIVKVSGFLFPEKECLVLGWAELRRAEICAAWSDLLNGKLNQDLKIKPLQ